MHKFKVVTGPDGLLIWQRACIDALTGSGLAKLEGILAPSKHETSGSAGLLWTAYAMWVRARLPGMRLVDAPSETDACSGQVGLARDCSSLDFVLSFAPLPLRCFNGVPRYGFWELRIGGLPPGELSATREAAYAIPTISLELVAHGGHFGATTVLRAANLKARRTHIRTLAKVLQVASEMCVQACRSLSAGGLLRPLPVATCGPQPSLGDLLRAESLRIGAGAIRRLFIREEWGIGLVRMSVSHLLEGQPMEQPDWIASADRRRFFADPFLLERPGRTHVMMEVYDEVEARGWIGALELAEAPSLSGAEPRVAIDMGCHMSYPHVFEHEGVTYCTPEVSEHGGLVLFRLDPREDRWERISILLRDVPILDPTLFLHDGRWWLLGTRAGSASDTDLHAWHAPSPLGPWTEHALNPVQSDVRCSRPAGSVFRMDGRLFRPAQDCADGYGRSLVIREILQLDDQRFAEVTRLRLEPDAGWRFPDGLHTMSLGEHLVVVDGKRNRLQFSKPARMVMRKVRNWLPRRAEIRP